MVFRYDSCYMSHVFIKFIKEQLLLQAVLLDLVAALDPNHEPFKMTHSYILYQWVIKMNHEVQQALDQSAATFSADCIRKYISQWPIENLWSILAKMVSQNDSSQVIRVISYESSSLWISFRPDFAQMTTG